MHCLLRLPRRSQWFGLICAFMLALGAIGSSAHAGDLRFSRSLGDHAVLQRDKPIHITGFAKPGNQVTVDFAGKSKTATANNTGEWAVVFEPMLATTRGAKLAATSGGETVELSDIVIGDVILFARQTYIDISLGRDAAGRALAAKHTVDPGFRVMQIKTIPAVDPRADLAAEATTGWAVVDKSNAQTLSAAAYHLGRDLSKAIEVPIGIVDLNMGPRFTIAWLDRAAIEGHDVFTGRKTRITAYAEWFADQMEKYLAQQAGRVPTESRDRVDEHPIHNPLFPAAGYNAVIHPMQHLRFRGILLQLGNDYAYMAYERMKRDGTLFDRDRLDDAWWECYLARKQGYRAGLDVIPRAPAMWRAYFSDPRLPVGLIMPPGSALSSYGIHNRETRELQRQTAEANPGVGLILPGTEHTPFSGQPADDVLLAERCEAWVLSRVFGKSDVVPTGPMFERVKLDYADAQVIFEQGTAEGLTAAPGALDHFEVAGVDRVWAPAKARIDGNTIRLTNDTVTRIAYVRYNYNEQPDQGLTNRAGLPAIPFRTGEHQFIDVPRNRELDLPREYTTPADQWQDGGVAIISGGGASYRNSAGWLGPTGVRVKPFGPNMRVEHVLIGSPAAGKIHAGDLIYKVNGEMLEDDHLIQVGRAIAQAESKAGGGHMSFSVRRDGELLDVDLKLEVLGSYSATSPYDCPKVDRLVSNSEKYLAERGGLASTYAGGGWLHSDTMFLLAAGTPKHQGLVRRFIYRKMAEIEKNGRAGGNAWHQGHGTLLFAEYYLATGDRKVLPYLKAYCDSTAAMQSREGTFAEMPERSIGGWRHNYPGGQWYGMIPVIGLPAMIGMTLSKEAGVEVDPAAFDRGMHMFRDHQAEMGFVDYAPVMPKHLAPEPLDPADVMSGTAEPRNGARAMAAILFDLNGDTRIAHLNSLYAAYAYNNAHGGHGSNFFNGMWTPLGAKQHSKTAYVHFMKNHYWYRDLKRMFNHVSLPARDDAPSVGHDLALVAPRERLRIVGAPESVFAANAPAVLQPALDRYYSQDYAGADQLAAKVLLSNTITGDERRKAEQLQTAARELQESIAHDVAKVEKLIRQGKYYEAGLDLPQLKGVMPIGDERLAALENAITTADAGAVREDQARYDALQKKLAFDAGAGTSTPDDDAVWVSLTTEAQLGRRRGNLHGLTAEQDATRWRVRVLESIEQAPDGWAAPSFEDSKWSQTALPISWHLNHTFVGRSTFEIEDVKRVAGLRVGVHAFRQLNIVVYINGRPVAKFNKCENNKGIVLGELTDAALKHLRQGKNTIAFSTTNDWRWSTRGGVSNGGFGLRLDMKPRKQ